MYLKPENKYKKSKYETQLDDIDTPKCDCKFDTCNLDKKAKKFVNNVIKIEKGVGPHSMAQRVEWPREMDTVAKPRQKVTDLAWGPGPCYLGKAGTPNDGPINHFGRKDQTKWHGGRPGKCHTEGPGKLLFRTHIGRSY